MNTILSRAADAAIAPAPHQAAQAARRMLRLLSEAMRARLQRLPPQHEVAPEFYRYPMP